MKYEINSDTHTVWINGLDGLLGRFNCRGTDIHSGGHCIENSCRFGPQTLQDWDAFKRAMFRMHDINVADEHMPAYLQKWQQSDQ